MESTLLWATPWAVRAAPGHLYVTGQLTLRMGSQPAGTRLAAPASEPDDERGYSSKCSKRPRTACWLRLVLILGPIKGGSTARTDPYDLPAASAAGVRGSRSFEAESAAWACDTRHASSIALDDPIRGRRNVGCPPRSDGPYLMLLGRVPGLVGHVLRGSSERL
jgi:hypothetical protein